MDREGPEIAGDGGGHRNIQALQAGSQCGFADEPQPQQYQWRPVLSEHCQMEIHFISFQNKQNGKRTGNDGPGTVKQKPDGRFIVTMRVKNITKHQLHMVACLWNIWIVPTDSVISNIKTNLANVIPRKHFLRWQLFVPFYRQVAPTNAAHDIHSITTQPPRVSWDPSIT